MAARDQGSAQPWGGKHPALGGILCPVAAIAGIAFFVVVWVVPVLVMDWSISWPKRLSLLERLEPYRPTSVADEAQRWLEDQQG